MGPHRQHHQPTTPEAQEVQEDTIEKTLDLAFLPTFAKRGERHSMPTHSLKRRGHLPEVAQQPIEDELILAGNARQNLQRL